MIFHYGTAGFRGPAFTLQDVCIRCGAAASVISVRRKAAVGLCLTASHNPVEDNGVKIIDSNGGMLEPDWENPIRSCTSKIYTTNFRVLDQPIIFAIFPGSREVFWRFGFYW
eukprot:GHVP01051246.1.p2 GENE.GHVP01051246.1~~GHVP01051246.1.p2  ORF type:complete len:112 (-),score=7.09 GHVP01051246.1:248-583(-)